MTGAPKAVPLIHANSYAESTKVEEVMHISDREVVGVAARRVVVKVA